MPQTVKALYHDGVIELLQRPVGILSSKALVVFWEEAEDEEPQTLDLRKVGSEKSSVDKWIGVIEGADLGDWKEERRAEIEGKMQ